MFSNYREVLVEFHNNAMAGKDIDPKLNHYLLENALKITLDRIYSERIPNNAMAGKDIDPKLNHYLLENALKITLDSIIYIRKDYPIWRTSTGIMGIINDIVTLKGYDFTETCQDFDNMLIQNIGAF